MTIIKRADLGRPLTWDELDDNFQQVDNLTAAASAAVSSASASATAAATSATASANSANNALSFAADASASATVAINALMNSTFEPADFDFTSGGTLDITDRNKAVYNPADNNWYSWSGVLPHVVAAGTDPTTDSNWRPRTDEVLRADLASTSGASLVTTSSGATVESVLSSLTGAVLFSKLVPNSTADQTALFQAEVNSLVDGMRYVLPKGIIRVSQVVVPALKNIYFDARGAIIKLPDGYNPLDKDQLRFNRLNNSFIDGLYLDGNRDNLAINGDDTSHPYGRVIGLRFGNSSSQVFVRNLSLMNMLYCGSQWGRDIQDITLDGVVYDNIGEHVFYISGKGGGNVSRVTWRRVRGGSLGINSNNTIEQHACAFIKSAQSDADGNPTIGDNDFFEIDSMVAAQATAPGYSAVIVINGYLRHLYVRQLRVGSNIGGILSPLGVCWYVDLDGVDASSDTVGCPMVYSYPTATLEFKRWTARNINMPGAYTQSDAQLFDLWEDCILARYTTSADKVGSSFAAGKQLRFKRVTFNSTAASCQPVAVTRDIIHEECLFNSAFGGANGAVDYIGQTSYSAGALVAFRSCKFANAGTYSVGAVNSLAQLELTNCYGGLGQIVCRSSTGLAKLKMSNVEMGTSVSTPVVASIINVKSVNNVFNINGLRDYASYRNTWNIATGLTTIGFNLSSVLIGTQLDAKDVQVTPAGVLAGATKFWVTVSGMTVNITIDAAATAGIPFSVAVLPKSLESELCF